MKVVVLQAGKEDEALKSTLIKIEEVLEELQVKVKHVSLSTVPYYDGKDGDLIKPILADIDEAAGVVMASRVELLSVRDRKSVV